MLELSCFCLVVALEKRELEVESGGCCRTNASYVSCVTLMSERRPGMLSNDDEDDVVDVNDDDDDEEEDQDDDVVVDDVDDDDVDSDNDERDELFSLL